MTLPAIRFASDATDETWTWVVGRLAGTAVRIVTSDRDLIEGEIADAVGGQVMIEDLYDARVRRTIPVDLITRITVL